MSEGNIGSTIKSVISIICVIGIIIFAITGIALISQGLGATGWTVMLVGIAMMALASLFLYGFGELIEKTCENNAALLRMEKEMIAIKEAQKADEQPGDAKGRHARGRSSSSPAAAPAAHAAKVVASKVSQPSTETAPVKGNALGEDVFSVIQTLGSAGEIYRYLAEKMQDQGDEDVRGLLEILERKASTEKAYGNDKRGALSTVEAFIRHGNRVFPVDRSGQNMRCPVCNREQRSDRASCLSCGALLRL